MNLITNNQEIFQTNSSIHRIKTRKKHNLNRENANQSFFNIFYASTKIFNSLPRSLTVVKNEQAKYKVVLRKYINRHCIYCVCEFVMCKDAL